MIHPMPTFKNSIQTAISCLAILACQTAFAQTAAKTIVGASCGTKFNGYGLDDPGSFAQPINVRDPAVPFTKGLRINLTAAKQFTYLAIQSCKTINPVKKNDVILATYWVRNANPSPDKSILNIEMNLQDDTSFETDFVSNTPIDDGTWKRYTVAFKAQVDGLGGAKSFQFRFGLAAQSFEIGGISVLNYGQISGPLPANITTQFSFYYPGRGNPNAPWRTKALTHIEATRKANLTIAVTKADGTAATKAGVVIRQLNSSFNWMTSAQPSDIVGGPNLTPDITAQDRKLYRTAIKANFNGASMQNELKWPDWEGDQNTPTKALAWFRVNNLRTRGHNLYWPSIANNYQLPSDIQDPATPVATVRQRSLDHINKINPNNKTEGQVAQLAGQIPEWDVVNEPYNNAYLQGLIAVPPFVQQTPGVLGNNIVVDWYKLVHATDPNTLLYLNDYNIFDNLDPVHRAYTVAYATFIKAGGAQLDGIGFQSHFGAAGPVFSDMDETLALFDPLVNHYGVTEFDAVTLDENLQADILSDFATYIFGSPKFSTFQIWGFWDGNQDSRNGPLYRRDWSLKPAGALWQQLTQKTWRTNTAGYINGQGQFSTRAFLGRYKITVSACGKTTTLIQDVTAATTVTVPTGC